MQIFVTIHDDDADMAICCANLTSDFLADASI
jgi:hypothetical protein